MRTYYIENKDLFCVSVKVYLGKVSVICEAKARSLQNVGLCTYSMKLIRLSSIIMMMFKILAKDQLNPFKVKRIRSLFFR